MLDFFTILFFSKTTLLTPEYVDVGISPDRYELTLNKPISAITRGAGIEIDVSKTILADGASSILQIREEVAASFPKGSITATLIGKGGEIQLTYQGNSMIGANSVRLDLSNVGIPTNQKFERLVLVTEVELASVKIYWRNYKL